jgi:hypothetical protein
VSFLHFYLVKRIQSILILADKDLVWHGICRSLLEGVLVIVDDCTMHILDRSLGIQTHSKCHVVSSVKQVMQCFPKTLVHASKK